MICIQLNLITRCGAPPSRWKNGLQVLLEKIPGIALVDKLRAILLMEGDFNFYNKWIFGHVAVNKLYEIGYIPEDQYSKRGSTAEDSKLDNRLTMDLSRQLRLPLVAVSADADKCYDRINHIMMSLLLLAISGDSGSIKAMLSCIQQMRFFQRTGRGDSNTFMGDRPSTDPLQGLCQGNGAAPACWLMLSSLMMRVYRQGGHVSTLDSPMSGTPIEFMGEIFVDDTDLLTMLRDVFSVSGILKIAQENLDKWARLLIATGGALNPSKCYWYMILYKCQDGEWEYENDLSHNMTILMPGGDRTKITQLPVTEGKKMLGVWSTPTGSDEKHLQEVILGKTSKWVGRLKNAQLPVHLAWKAYRYQLWPSIKYGLGTLATTRTVMDRLLHKLEFAMLSHLGVNQHVKTEWRRIPREFGGIGLYNLVVEQFIAWIEIFLQHYGAGFTTSKKLRASLEALQLELGCASNPLNEEYEVLGALATEGWVKAVWERTSYYGFKIVLDYPTDKPPRTNDRSLMAVFLEKGKHGKELISLNRCRIAHQAIYLSCISTADGKSLDETHLSPPRTTERLSSYLFAREEPTKQDWIMWEKFWREYCNRFLELPVKLEGWVSASHRIWPWLYDVERDALYHQNFTTLSVYIPLVKRTTRAGSLYIFLSEVNVVPTTAVPISINNVTEDVVSIRIGKGPPLPPLQPPSPTFWESLMNGGGEWMWDYVSDRSPDLVWLKRALEEGTAILATDGSFSRTRCSTVCGAGWIIACRRCKRTLSGSFSEWSSSANAYRGELLGLVALHTLLLQMCRYYNLTKAKGKITCDSKSALMESGQRRRRIRPGAPQGDIFLTLRSIHQEIPWADITYEWVKSHQDSRLPWRCLTLEEQLNTTCDALANGAVTRALTLGSRPTTPTLLPFERAAVVLEGVKITSQVAPAIRHALGKVEARLFYTRAVDRVRGSNRGGLGWNEQDFDAVDWEALSRVLQKKPEGFQLWLSKQSIGVCATQKNTARIQDILDDRCPNCGKQGEDNKHLNRCHDPG